MLGLLKQMAHTHTHTNTQTRTQTRTQANTNTRTNTRTNTHALSGSCQLEAVWHHLLLHVHAHATRYTLCEERQRCVVHVLCPLCR